ncbi:MAG TPA: glutaminyl-peptide cyclotransferase [Chitinophagaceae bacterium]|nr:glutaminyl-peptide cyclotransferase [Chitinophagaceae bacterium]
MKRTFTATLFIILLSACNNNDSPDTPGNPDPNAPKPVGYSIVRTYPHDTSSFTQGLILYNGNLYEGTG